MGPWIVVLACGCANGAAVTPTTAMPPEDPMTQLRRDNAALRRRVQMLEDRVLNLEQGGEHTARGVSARGVSARAGAVHGEHTLPDGRSLPVVRLAPRGDRTAAPAAAMPAPARPKSRSLTAAPPTSAPDDLGFDPELDAEPSYIAEDPTEPQPASRSFRLEGTRLVDLTTKAGPAAPDRPDRSRHGQPIIVEYEAAMAIYESGQAERAEAAFAAFARTHPRHDYADNALYWKGEAAYDQQHYGDALAAFTEVVERYGGGNKAPDALLKIGLCYRQLGDLPNARDVLTELIAAYPGERASDIARVKLVELEP